MKDRDRHLMVEAVYRREAEARKDTQPGFARTLLEWADNARRRADGAAGQMEMELC